jgi:hypothetical protein
MDGQTSVSGSRIDPTLRDCLRWSGKPQNTQKGLGTTIWGVEIGIGSTGSLKNLERNRAL